MKELTFHLCTQCILYCVLQEEAEVEMEEAEMEMEEILSSDMPEAKKVQAVEKLKEKINDCEERMELAMEEMLRYVAAEDADSEGVGSEIYCRSRFAVK